MRLAIVFIVCGVMVLVGMHYCNIWAGREVINLVGAAVGYTVVACVNWYVIEKTFR